MLRQALRNRPALESIVKAVAVTFKLPESQIIEPQEDRRKRNDARKIAIYYCQQVGDIPLLDIANGFGLNHVGSVSRLIHDARLIIKNENLQQKLKKIEKQLLVIQ